MPVYRLTPGAPQKYPSYKWKAPLVFVSFVAIAAACNNYEPAWRDRYPQLPDIPFHLYPLAVIGAIFSFGFMFAVHYALKNMMTLQIEVTAQGIARSGGPQTDLFVAWGEITGYVERKQGIFLCTADTTHKIFVPSDLEGYEEIRHELALSGFRPITAEGTVSLWRWVYLLVAVISISLILMLSDRRIVTGNLTVVMALSGLGYVAWRNQFRWQVTATK